MMYSPGHNRASSLTLTLAYSRVCASSTKCRLPSPRTLKTRNGRGIQTPDGDDLLGGTVERLSHRFGVLGCASPNSMRTENSAIPCRDGCPCPSPKLRTRV